jgi:hypothetical protein
MASWSIQKCSVGDGADLAYNNVSAFWTDPTWSTIWPKCVLPSFAIEQVRKRTPRNLLLERDRRRHQKAVDPATGELVGYARWILPSSHAGDEWWPEAQVADVSAEEKKAFEKEFEAAWWHFDDQDTEIDIAMSAVKKRMLAERDYLGEWQP